MTVCLSFFRNDPRATVSYDYVIDLSLTRLHWPARVPDRPRWPLTFTHRDQVVVDGYAKWLEELEELTDTTLSALPSAPFYALLNFAIHPLAGETWWLGPETVETLRDDARTFRVPPHASEPWAVIFASLRRHFAAAEWVALTLAGESL